MVLKIDTNKLKSAFVFGLLFFAAMNFYAKFFYFVFASLLLLFIIQRRLLFNKASTLYLVLGILMAVYNADEGVLSMIRCMAYAALYVVGNNMAFKVLRNQKNLVDYDPQYSEKKGYALLATIAAGSFTHYLLNFFTNYGDALGRNTNDVWTGVVMAATGQATLACLMLGLSVAMVFLPPKRGLRGVSIVCILCMLSYNLVLAGRTMIVILMVLLVVSVLYMHKTLKSASQWIKLALGLLFALMVAVVLFMYDVGGIQGYIFESNLFDRFGFSLESFTSDSSRATSKLAYLANAYKYPLGGLNMRAEFGYAHDLLLDAYDEYGVAALMLLVLILGSGIRSLYKLLKHTSYGKEFKLALLCVYVSMLLEFCAEPILAGMPWLFSCYCLVNGCISGMNLSYFSENSGVGNESITS